LNDIKGDSYQAVGQSPIPTIRKNSNTLFSKQTKQEPSVMQKTELKQKSKRQI
jgi:hypothetical protein